MSGFTFTSDELVDNIKRRGSVPTAQPLFTVADFLDFADGELQTVIVPMLIGLKSNYLVYSIDYDLTSSLEYPIPPDAIAMKIQNVFVVDSNGNQFEVPELMPANYSNTTYASLIQGYHLQNNTIVISPQAYTGFVTLRVFYFKRPNKLVRESEAAQVVSIDTLNNELTVTNIPSAWVANDEVCCIQGTPGFNQRFEDRVVVGVSTPILQLDDVSDVVVGDWIALNGESPIPQIPPEAHQLLAQAVIVKCHEAKSSREIITIAQQKYDQIKENFLRMASPRVDSKNKKIVTSNNILRWSRKNNTGRSGGFGF